MNTKYSDERNKRIRRYEIYSDFRNRAGLNDYKVAKATGIAQTTFTDWKNGVSEPKVGKLFLISEVLGVRIEDFVLDEEKNGI